MVLFCEEILLKICSIVANEPLINMITENLHSFVFLHHQTKKAVVQTNTLKISIYSSNLYDFFTIVRLNHGDKYDASSSVYSILEDYFSLIGF